MRTVPFRTVYEGVIRRLGYNPRGDAVKEDVAQNVILHLNDQVRFAWAVWEWPELNAVEWRAFRKVWTPSVQVNQGEDVYYLGDGITVPASANIDPPTNWPGPHEGYYNCFSTPPVGTLPTNTAFFNLYGGTVLTTQFLDRYIAYAQPNQNIIGDLLDVYSQNPRLNRWSKIVKSAPSSKGIDVSGAFNVVWIRYRIPESQFTIQPFVPGLTPTGGSYYDPVSGNCFISTIPTTAPFPPGPSTSDTVIPFPIFLKGYVVPAAYADVVMETNTESQIRMANAQAAVAEAERYLQREIYRLAEQGQRLNYPAFPSRRRHHGSHFAGIDIQPGAIPIEVIPNFS